MLMLRTPVWSLPPRNRRCTSLATLHLVNVFLEQHMVRRIAAACPQLTHLTITGEHCSVQGMCVRACMLDCAQTPLVCTTHSTHLQHYPCVCV
jgi:hypothetical protein